MYQPNPMNNDYYAPQQQAYYPPPQPQAYYPTPQPQAYYPTPPPPPQQQGPMIIKI